MDEQSVGEKSSFKQKVELERKKFWDMEGNRKVSEDSDFKSERLKAASKSTDKKGNILLFITTLIISIAICAYILFVIVG